MNVILQHLQANSTIAAGQEAPLHKVYRIKQQIESGKPIDAVITFEIYPFSRQGDVHKRSEAHQEKAQRLKAVLKDLSNDEKLALLNDAIEKLKLWGKPEREPDYSYWKRMEFWKKEEAILLILNIDPYSILLESLVKFRTHDETPRRAAELSEIYDRSVTMQKLTNPTTPFVFFEWCKAKGFDFPEALTPHDALTLIKQIGELHNRLEKSIEDRSECWDNCARAMALVNTITPKLDAALEENETLKQQLSNLSEQSPTQQSSELGPKKEENLIKTIAALAMALAKSQKNLRSNNGEPNVKQIAAAVLTAVSDENGNYPNGLSSTSIQTRISEGLTALKKL